jgi:hypothetical protein
MVFMQTATGDLLIINLKLKLDDMFGEEMGDQEVDISPMFLGNTGNVGSSEGGASGPRSPR